MLQTFYYQFYPVIMRICVRYAPNLEDAEQWVHDSFIKIFEQLDAFQFKGSFEGWIKKIAIRICLDHIRNAKALKFEMLQNTIPTDWQNTDTHHFIENDILSKWSTEELLQIINRLPEKSKIVWNLHILDGYSLKETAQILDIKENYTYWLLHQARKQLQQFLNPIIQKEVNNEHK